MNPRGTLLRPSLVATYRRQVRRLLTLLMALALGLGLAAPAGAIVNGAPSTPGTFGFLVALLDTSRMSTQNAFQSQFCGGSLTTPTTVVTAAHCVVDQQSGVRDLPASVTVGFGRSLNDPSIRTVAVTLITVHPNYSIATGENDVAVLTLASPVTDVSTIKPITSADIATLETPGTKATVAGWGALGSFGKNFSDVSRVGDLVLAASRRLQGWENVPDLRSKEIKTRHRQIGLRLLWFLHELHDPVAFDIGDTKSRWIFYWFH